MHRARNSRFNIKQCNETKGERNEEEGEVDDGNLSIYGAVIEIIELPSK